MCKEKRKGVSDPSVMNGASKATANRKARESKLAQSQLDNATDMNSSAVNGSSVKDVTMQEQGDHLPEGKMAVLTGKVKDETMSDDSKSPEDLNVGAKQLSLTSANAPVSDSVNTLDISRQRLDSSQYQAPQESQEQIPSVKSARLFPASAEYRDQVNLFFYADEKGEKKLSKSFKNNELSCPLTFSITTVQVCQKPTLVQEMMPGKFDFYANFPFLTQFETQKKTNLAHVQTLGKSLLGDLSQYKLNQDDENA
jgi:hypothetical protein